MFLRAMLAIVLTMLVTVVFAGNLSFLENTSVARFNDEDVSLMMKNVEQVLESTSHVSKQEWSNPKTGAAGFAETRGQFTAADGTLCKRLRVGNKARGVATAGESNYTVCKYPDRGWTLDPSAMPAAAK
jgi:hypothetical protein